MPFEQTPKTVGPISPGLVVTYEPQQSSQAWQLLGVAVLLLAGIAVYAAVAATVRRRSAIGRLALNGLVETLALSVRASRRLRKASDAIWQRVEKRLNTPS